MFLKHGLFTEPHQPEVKPYLHLAAKLGHRTLINLLLTYRINDNRVIEESALHMDVKGKQFTERKLKPLDIAALEGHLQCVYMILTQGTIKRFPEYAKSSYLSLATLESSPMAVKLLLNNDKKEEDILEAVETALKSASADCLRLLLDTGVETKSLFEGKNLYHVLYTFGSAVKFGKEGYARIPEVTEVLVKWKHDVNRKDPTNTYPLYSLIRNSVCVHNYVFTQYYIESMRVLLKNGADPNFDEMAYERALQKRGKKSIVGRPAYSSAFHCLMETVETYADTFESKGLAVKFVMECVESICQTNSGKNLNHIRQIGGKGSTLSGSILHQFAKSSVILGVDATVFRYLLRQGADVDCKVKNKYFFNVFIDTLFKHLNERSPHVEQPDRTTDVKEMLKLSELMSQTSVAESFKIFAKENGMKSTPQTSKYIKLVNQYLSKSVKDVRSLRRITAESLWRFCGRNDSNVHKLPISVKYKPDILPV
ncbi:hypothetical protein FSP39_013839 [Pinctada imbricata]|uniref:Uncharacterized protein n=1 Tax=Pinctada imbricata TaxID=66713 RepID=A0AA88XD67_PINIB|nr:hypothetical protein FSP39_013839 [Pinctada imbricata]